MIARAAAAAAIKPAVAAEAVPAIITKIDETISRTLVIGRTDALKASGAIGPDEYTLLDKLRPKLATPKANWVRNDSVLRAELRTGITKIRDASPGDYGGQFLNAERSILEDRGWKFDPKTSTWYAPGFGPNQ